MLGRLWIAGLLLSALLAGCSDAPKPAADTDPAGTAGTTVPALTSVAAPRWQPGQWWQWQLSFGSETRAEPFTSVVVETGSGFIVASDVLSDAKQEAAFGIPLLGAIGSQLEMEGYGGAWSLLQFPLTDGKTWTAQIPNIAWDVLLPAAVIDVTMTATLDPSLPGFRLTGVVEQGTLLQATYLPQTGWFGQLDLFDIDPGQEELEVGFKAIQAGLNFTGTTYRVEATSLLRLQDGSGFDNDPTAGGQPFVSPQPSGSFAMTEGTVLYGVLSAEAVLGARSIVLVDPSNQERHVIAQAAMDQAEEVLFIDEPGQAGQWHVATTGAAGYSGGYVELYELVVTETVW